MTGAMYAAIGGLKTHMSNLNVIGNNIANVNTQAYKSQRMTFQESMYTTSKAGSNGTVSQGGNNPSQIGYGSTVGSIDLNMSPGTYSPTGYDLDCMIDGEGFFIVGDKDTGDGVNGSADLSNFELTRMGDFWVDPQGYICDRRGKCVYGYAMVQNPDYDPSQPDLYPQTILSTQLVPLRLPLAAAAPLNGDASWQEGDPVYNVLSSCDINNNNARSNFSVGALLNKVYEYASATTNVRESTDVEVITIVPAGSTGGTTDGTSVEITLSQQDLEDLGLSTADNFAVSLRVAGGSIIGVESISIPDGFNETNSASLRDPDGNGAYGSYNNLIWPIPNAQDKCVSLTGMSINKNGAITGTAGNGQVVTVGYVAVVNAAANDGVTHIDGYYYKAQEGAGDLTVSVLGGLPEHASQYMNNKFVTTEDGYALTYPATNDRIEAGGTAEIRNAGLEASTADVATEFANMILTQRGYQANTRMITVTDSMLEELVNMKR